MISYWFINFFSTTNWWNSWFSEMCDFFPRLNDNICHFFPLDWNLQFFSMIEWRKLRGFLFHIRLMRFTVLFHKWLGKIGFLLRAIDEIHGYILRLFAESRNLFFVTDGQNLPIFLWLIEKICFFSATINKIHDFFLWPLMKFLIFFPWPLTNFVIFFPPWLINKIHAFIPQVIDKICVISRFFDKIHGFLFPTTDWQNLSIFLWLINKIHDFFSTTINEIHDFFSMTNWWDLRFYFTSDWLNS